MVLSPCMVGIRHSFATAASEADVAQCIRQIRETTGYLLEPHTACGLVASTRTAPERPATIPDVVLGTAHPAKFPEAMRQIVGATASLPARLARLMEDPERITTLDNDLAAVQRYILDSTHTGRAAAQ